MYLAPLFSRFENTWARRVRSACSQTSSAGWCTRSVCRCASMTVGWSRSRQQHVRSRTRLRRSSSFPRLTRETSSRSSTRWTSWPTCRSITFAAFGQSQRVGLGAQDLQGVADGRQRVAQLVGQRRQEFVLPRIGRANLVVQGRVLERDRGHLRHLRQHRPIVVVEPAVRLVGAVDVAQRMARARGQGNHEAAFLLEPRDASSNVTLQRPAPRMRRASLSMTPTMLSWVVAALMVSDAAATCRMSRGPRLLACQRAVQRDLRLAIVGDVAEDQHGAKHDPGRPANRRGAVGDGPFRPVLRDEHGVVGEPDDDAVAQRADHRVLDSACACLR